MFRLKCWPAEAVWTIEKTARAFHEYKDIELCLTCTSFFVASTILAQGYVWTLDGGITWDLGGNRSPRQELAQDFCLCLILSRSGLSSRFPLQYSAGADIFHRRCHRCAGCWISVQWPIIWKTLPRMSFFSSLLRMKLQCVISLTTWSKVTFEWTMTCLWTVSTMRCMILAFLLLFVSGSGSLTRIILFRVGGEI